MKLRVELLQQVNSVCHPLSWTHQVSYPEVELILPLPKSTSRDAHDACLVNHLHTIQEIRFNTQFFSLLHSLLPKGYPRKGIHSPLDLCAFHVNHFIERGA